MSTRQCAAGALMAILLDNCHPSSYPYTGRVKLAPTEKGEEKLCIFHYNFNNSSPIDTFSYVIYSCIPVTPSVVTGNCTSRKSRCFHRTTLRHSGVWDEPGCLGEDRNHCFLQVCALSSVSGHHLSGMNVRSLNSKHKLLCQFLELFNLSFGVIVLSEGSMILPSTVISFQDTSFIMTFQPHLMLVV